MGRASDGRLTELLRGDFECDVGARKSGTRDIKSRLDEACKGRDIVSVDFHTFDGGDRSCAWNDDSRSSDLTENGVKAGEEADRQEREKVSILPVTLLSHDFSLLFPSSASIRGLVLHSQLMRNNKDKQASSLDNLLQARHSLEVFWERDPRQISSVDMRGVDNLGQCFPIHLLLTHPHTNLRLKFARVLGDVGCRDLGERGTPGAGTDDGYLVLS